MMESAPKEYCLLSNNRLNFKNLKNLHDNLLLRSTVIKHNWFSSQKQSKCYFIVCLIN